MTKKRWRWLRWPLLFGFSAVVGWAATSAVVQRRISAVWQDVPTRRISMYPAPLGRGVEARVHRLTKRESLDDFTAWLAELAAETSPDRLRAALDAVRGLPDDWKTTATEVALAHLADIDPRAALDYALLRLGDGSPGWNALANVLRSQAADHPDAVRRFLPAAARQLAHGQGGVEVLGSLNPDESLAFIQRWHLPVDHPGVQECVQGAIGMISMTDPARALDALEALQRKEDGPGGTWQGMIHSIAARWAVSDPDATLHWIQAHSDSPNGPFGPIIRGNYLEGLAIGQLARSDPQRVIDWFGSHHWNDNERGSPEGNALAGLQRVDPAAAWQVLTTMIPPNEQAAMAAGIVKTYSWDDLGPHAEKIIDWVAAWPPEWRSSGPPMGGNVDATLGDKDFQRWLSLGVKLSEAGQSRIADQVERDPAGAIADFRASTSAAQRSALPGMIAGLVDTAPSQAAALLQELPRGEAWAAAAAQLAGAWSQFNRPAADAWINTLPPGTASRLKLTSANNRQ